MQLFFVMYNQRAVDYSDIFIFQYSSRFIIACFSTICLIFRSSNNQIVPAIAWFKARDRISEIWATWTMFNIWLPWKVYGDFTFDGKNIDEKLGLYCGKSYRHLMTKNQRSNWLKLLDFKVELEIITHSCVEYILFFY